MSGAQESLTHKWLRQNVQPYASKDTVYAHIDAVLSRFPSLRPKTDVYTYDDGRTQLLLCLHGLLPISYRGAAYNIPVALWVPREYPRAPPIAYVVPTADMLVRPSAHMDVSGRCTIDYVAHWARKSEGCNLAALLEAMQEHFSRAPPVYARPKTATSSTSVYAPADQHRPSSRASTEYAARPPPPLPLGSLAHDDRPPLPAKPGLSLSAPVSSAPTAPPPAARVQSPGAIGVGAGAGAASPYATRPPPLPPAPDVGLPQYRPSPPASLPPQYAPASARPPPPPVNHASHPSLSGPGSVQMPRYASPAQGMSPPQGMSPQVASPPQVMSPQGMSPPSTYGLPPRPPLPPTITQPQPLAQRPGVPPPFLAQQQGGQVYASPVPPPPFSQPPQPAAGPSAYGAPAPSPPPPASAPAPIPAAMRPPPSLPPPDILDADDFDVPSTTAPSVPSPPPTGAPAPPRPPNPELVRLHAALHTKLSFELSSLRHALALDAERLRAHQADLLAGEPALRDESARLEAVRDVCLGVAERLRGVVQEAEAGVEGVRRRGEPGVDELVCAVSIVHDQLINLVAEDNAIEDTVYHLHRALNAGRIDLERFLRTTRVLAEEQFMKRALIEKILAGIPMQVVGGESDAALAAAMRSGWA